MAIDLGGTFTTVQGLLDQLLPTSGTSLDLARPGPDGHVNPVTLQPAGGSTTKMRASRITARSVVALRAMASAVCSGNWRSLQSVKRTKPRAELWSPPRPVMELKLTTSGCLAK